jgi:hypothetical protein
MKVGVIENEDSETKSKRICSECGSAMAEVERINEDNHTFVWYRCVRAGCKERWLEKRATPSPARANLVEIRHR